VDQLDDIQRYTMQLFDYCKRNGWAGYDPYDALNSRMFGSTPFSKSKVCRIAFTQILKRLPINFRPILEIPKEQNPKAIALFLTASLKLLKSGLLENREIITSLAERLIELRSPDSAYWCWGYSFPWQTRTVLVPKWAPNLVCTSFVANSLFDLHEASGESRYRSIAVGSAEYLLNELYWEEGGSVACFSYPLPSSRSRVHNANFLGSALLLRAFKHTGDEKFLGPALKAARYSAAMQHEDGSWDYGEMSTQRWVDNFHTGYNLCALRSICRDAGTSEFEPQIHRGFDFYRKHFFREDGAPRYFHNRTYPIDIHSVAQSIVTLLAFTDFGEGNLTLARDVFRWAINNMWDGQGSFYYQKLPYHTTKISYMRWSQAWMLYALSILIERM